MRIAVFIGAGFLGGLVGGLIAGFAALWISRAKVPSWARGLMPVCPSRRPHRRRRHRTRRPVTLATAGGDPVDAGSALFIMTLGAACGDQVTVTSDDEAAVAKISELVAADLDA